MQKPGSHLEIRVGKIRGCAEGQVRYGVPFQSVPRVGGKCTEGSNDARRSLEDEESGCVGSRHR